MRAELEISVAARMAVIALGVAEKSSWASILRLSTFGRKRAGAGPLAEARTEAEADSKAQDWARTRAWHTSGYRKRLQLI